MEILPWIFDCQTEMWGPYISVGLFQSDLTNGLEMKHVKGDFPAGLKDLAIFYAQQVDSEVVFTHGDLSSFNIVVQRDRVTSTVDWETAGWLP